jgi:hypothetical protein
MLRLALPSLYSRTASPEFDKAPKEFSGPLLRSFLRIGPDKRTAYGCRNPIALSPRAPASRRAASNLPRKTLRSTLRARSSCLGRHPAGVIGREAAGRKDDMEMRMELEFLIPGSKISYFGLGG